MHRSDMTRGQKVTVSYPRKTHIGQVQVSSMFFAGPCTQPNMPSISKEIPTYADLYPKHTAFRCVVTK
jgi:hypothetical protein